MTSGGVILSGEIIDVTIKSVQSTNEKFINYTIKLTYESNMNSSNSTRLDWTIDKRYSDFQHLHTTLLWQNKSDSDALPLQSLAIFPPKLIFTSSLELENIYMIDRKVKLQAYLNTLLKLCEKISNSHVMNFIGLLKILPEAKPKLNPITLLYPSMKRPSLHISLLPQELDTGDIILFKCKNQMSKIQRNITGAEWDHVGVVVNLSINSYRAFVAYKSKKNTKNVPKPKLQVLHRSYYNEDIKSSQTILCLIECTGEGVTCHPLHNRMKAYDFYQICEYIGVRRLNIENHISRKTTDLPKVGILNLRRSSYFLTHVIGRPYQLRLRNLAYNLISSTSTSTNMSCTSNISSPSSHLICQMSALTSNNQNMIDHEEYRNKIKEISKLFQCTSSSVTRPAYTLDNADIIQSSNDKIEYKKRTSSEDIRTTIELNDNRINTVKEEKVNNDKINNDEVKNTYFCSELVAAYLKTLGVMQSDCPSEEHFWPGSFAVNGLLDKYLISPMFYGETILIDSEVNSIGYHNAKIINARLSNTDSSHSSMQSLLSDDSVTIVENAEDLLIDYTNVKTINTFVPSL